MSRGLRNVQRAPIIEISDSEDDVKSVAKDDDSDYEIKSESRRDVKKGKQKSWRDDNKRSAKASSNVKPECSSVRRKQKATGDAIGGKQNEENDKKERIKTTRRSGVVHVNSPPEDLDLKGRMKYDSDDAEQDSGRESMKRKRTVTGDAKSEQSLVKPEKQKSVGVDVGGKRNEETDRKAQNKVTKRLTVVDVTSSSEDLDVEKRINYESDDAGQDSGRKSIERKRTATSDAKSERSLVKPEKQKSVGVAVGGKRNGETNRKAQNKVTKRLGVVDVTSSSEDLDVEERINYDSDDAKQDLGRKSMEMKRTATSNAKPEKNLDKPEKQTSVAVAVGGKRNDKTDGKTQNKATKTCKAIDIISSSEDEMPLQMEEDDSNDDKHNLTPKARDEERKKKEKQKFETVERNTTDRKIVDKAKKGLRIVDVISSSEDEMSLKTEADDSVDREHNLSHEAKDRKRRGSGAIPEESPANRKRQKVTSDAERRKQNAATDQKAETKVMKIHGAIDIISSSEDEMPLRTAENDSNDDKQNLSSDAKKRKRPASKNTIAEKGAKVAKKSLTKGKTDETDMKLAEKSRMDEVNGNDLNLPNDAVACADWSVSDYISEFNNVDRHVAERIEHLFKDDNTIPFIARYRKEITGGMEPEQLRSIKESYDQSKLIKERAAKYLKSIDKLGKWSPEIHAAITAAKSLNELDHIYSPYKTGSKRSLAERAKELGLGPISDAVLQGQPLPAFSSLINLAKEGLEDEDQIKRGIMHIIADIISKDQTTLEKIRELRKVTFIMIETSKSKSARPPKTTQSKSSRPPETKTVNDKLDKHKEVNEKKFENYFKFQSSEKYIRTYQILAINRGEAQKILSVKIIIPDGFQYKLKSHCLERYKMASRASYFHRKLLEESFDDAYHRLIYPLVTRQVRHEMNEKAERASIEVFASNLKKLLLSPPFRGKTVLGIDPGFYHGCKLAVVSEQGYVLETATIYPHLQYGDKLLDSKKVLINLIRKYNCSTVALGNATACRETETFLTNLIQCGAFAPVDVSYTIVDEAGASIYSCSPEAKSEFPTLEPNLISAVSIARRLQDPLAELVKVDPKHLGVGMYQHDLPQKQLQLTLTEVITEAVSFVGVDVNTASQCLLTRVAGLNVTRATNIIEHRNKHGPFTNRNQLLKVKGIGKKSYEQSAGFIRILPETALTTDELQHSKNSLNYLDQTWIHPESYELANKFLKDCKCNINDFGSKDFIDRITSYAEVGFGPLANKFHTSVTTIEVIVKGLSMARGEDIRVKEEAPLFRRNLRNMDDLIVGTKLSGLVRNVTHFGAFVDIGVGVSGLIHVGRMKDCSISLGQRVEVEVSAIDRTRNRIALDLNTKL